MICFKVIIVPSHLNIHTPFLKQLRFVFKEKQINKISSSTYLTIFLNSSREPANTLAQLKHMQVYKLTV